MPDAKIILFLLNVENTHFVRHFKTRIKCIFIKYYIKY